MLTRVLNSTLKAHGIETESRDVHALPFHWKEELWGLNKADVYRCLSVEQKRLLLEHLSDSLLMDSYFIETMGMDYCAKMVLQSHNEEEKVFYSFMGQEEAGHLELLKPWFPSDYKNKKPSEFCNLLRRVVDHADRRSALLIIQVLLEGWGLHFYKELAEYSTDSKLTERFKSILADESRHHSSGVLAFESAETTQASDSFISEALAEVMSMVQVGPVTALTELSKANGGLTQQQLVDSLSQMQAQESAQEKLSRLKVILSKVLPDSTLQNMESLFRPYDLSTMASAVRTNV